VFPDGFDMGSLIQQAQQMQEQLAAAQQELAEVTVTGTAGGGLVEATVSGLGELSGLKISPEAADPQDTETLADLVVAAIRDANAQAEALQQEKLGPLAALGQGGGFGGGLPGGGTGGATFPLGF
jgi:DNA-binding YbaB/EbfC family protein